MGQATRAIRCRALKDRPPKSDDVDEDVQIERIIVMNQVTLDGVIARRVANRKQTPETASPHSGWGSRTVDETSGRGP